jgi:hypothetical protein
MAHCASSMEYLCAAYFIFIFLVFNLNSLFAQIYAHLVIFRLLAGIGGSAPNTVDTPFS